MIQLYRILYVLQEGPHSGASYIRVRSLPHHDLHLCLSAYMYKHTPRHTHTHTCMNAIKMFALSAQPAAALNRGNRAVFSLLGAKIYKTNL